MIQSLFCSNKRKLPTSPTLLALLVQKTKVNVKKVFKREAEPCFANTCDESCDRLKRKPNNQYSTENQGLWSRTIFLLLDQFKTNRGLLKLQKS